MDKLTLCVCASLPVAEGLAKASPDALVCTVGNGLDRLIVPVGVMLEASPDATVTIFKKKCF